MRSDPINFIHPEYHFQDPRKSKLKQNESFDKALANLFTPIGKEHDERFELGFDREYYDFVKSLEENE